ncbi:MAG: peptide chain release factor N(5)-glutamine methyltransferase [Lentisphaerae bacterium]|nr:peptide chain release factor N(5)-glutamine methyltransferase [Lentisphaerota bacterium]
MTTVQAILSETTAVLNAAGIDESRLQAEWLVSHGLSCRRLELYARFGETVAVDEADRIRAGAERLRKGEPLQYVLGEADFMGFIFKVDRRCLIPRPETEGLVQTVLDIGALWRKGPPVLLDVGTGSGCIVISLARLRLAGRYRAVDISPEALALAKTNAELHGVRDRIGWTTGDIFLPPFLPGLDAVVSNPPYVRTGDWAHLPSHVRDHEPRLALDGGPDGLAVIRRLVGGAALALRPGGWLAMEIGDTQGRAVTEQLQEAGFRNIRISRDLAGKDRYATARREKGRG